MLAALPISVRADINPWIASEYYNPAKSDTAAPETDTPWMHPGTWTPGQNWGWLSGNTQAPNVFGN